MKNILKILLHFLMFIVYGMLTIVLYLNISDYHTVVFITIGIFFMSALHALSMNILNFYKNL